jgi:DNA-binding CsgD family transcriptional regulator
VSLVPAALPHTTVLDFLAPLAGASSVLEFRAVALQASELIPGSKRRFSDVAPGAADAEHPATLHIRDSGDASPTAISRVVTERQFRATALYRELHRWVGVTDELVIPVLHDVLPASIAIGRPTWGFTDDELLLAGQLQRLLTVTYRWCRERQIVRVGTPMAERLARSHGRDLLVSHPAGDLRHLDGRPAVLDEALSAAIRDATRLALRVVARGEPGSPLVEVASASADGQQFMLRVHAPDVDGDLLPITLERSRAVITAEELARHGLTRRQGEVMSLVLSGATNGGAASVLGISERTVEKHVLAAYDKLGVRTRTRALLAVLE